VPSDTNRQNLFRSLSGERRELFTACLRSLYERLHGPSADYTHNSFRGVMKAGWTADKEVIDSNVNLSLVPSPPRTDFSALLLVTDKPWRPTHYIEGRGETEEKAHSNCLSAAVKLGWKPPAWWQWWRKRDYSSPKTFGRPGEFTV
jgi:hypothetical protein